MLEKTFKPEGMPGNGVDLEKPISEFLESGTIEIPHDEVAEKEPNSFATYVSAKEELKKIKEENRGFKVNRPYVPFTVKKNKK